MAEQDDLFHTPELFRGLDGGLDVGQLVVQRGLRAADAAAEHTVAVLRQRHAGGKVGVVAVGVDADHSNRAALV